jgi:hypothetical protein
MIRLTRSIIGLSARITTISSVGNVRPFYLSAKPVGYEFGIMDYVSKERR